MSFWATWCKPCKEELANINEVYEDWQEETNVKLIAISIDDMRNASKIKPLVNSKGWEYEVYHDSNSEFATKMGVKPIPHTFLFDGNKQIVWNHPGYTEGDEDKLFEKYLKSPNEKICNNYFIFIFFLTKSQNIGNISEPRI